MYFILLGGAEPERVAAGVVSWDYFQTLGVTPLLGRTFRAEDDGHDAPATLVLSHEYLAARVRRKPRGHRPRRRDERSPAHDRRRAARRADVPAGRTTSTCRGRRVPFRMSPGDRERRGGGMASAIGRPQARPVTRADRGRPRKRRAQHSRRTYPASYRADRGYALTASPLRREFTRHFESTLLILVSTAGFVLLIVCASVANLAVARTMRRDRELALRTALGASQGRLLRQLVTESLHPLARRRRRRAAARLRRHGSARAVRRRASRRGRPKSGIDTTVLLFTLGVSLLTGTSAAVLPAVSRRLGPRRAAIAACARGLDSRQRPAPARLIVAEVAASFMLLIGAGLMVRSLLKLTGVDPGFSTDHVLTMQIDMNFTKYRDARRARRLPRPSARGDCRQIPGVTAVGATGAIPFLEQAGGVTRLAADRGTWRGGPGSAAIRAARLADDRERRLLPRDGHSTARGTVLRVQRQPRCPGRGRGQRVVRDAELAGRKRNRPADLGQRRQDVAHRRSAIVANVRQQLALEPVAEVYASMRQVPYVTTNWAIRSHTEPDGAGATRPRGRTRHGSRPADLSPPHAGRRARGVAGAAAPDDDAAGALCRAGARHHRGRDRRRHRVLGQPAHAGVRRARRARRQPSGRRLDGGGRGSPAGGDRPDDWPARRGGSRGAAVHGAVRGGAARRGHLPRRIGGAPRRGRPRLPPAGAARGLNRSDDGAADGVGSRSAVGVSDTAPLTGSATRRTSPVPSTVPHRSTPTAQLTPDRRRGSCSRPDGRRR